MPQLVAGQVAPDRLGDGRVGREQAAAGIVGRHRRLPRGLEGLHAGPVDHLRGTGGDQPRAVVGTDVLRRIQQHGEPAGGRAK